MIQIIKQNNNNGGYRSFWVPNFKWQLVNWFISQDILTKNKAERMNKNQLYGKYFKIRKEKENESPGNS